MEKYEKKENASVDGVNKMQQLGAHDSPSLSVRVRYFLTSNREKLWLDGPMSGQVDGQTDELQQLLILIEMYEAEKMRFGWEPHQQPSFVFKVKEGKQDVFLRPKNAQMIGSLRIHMSFRRFRRCRCR